MARGKTETGIAGEFLVAYKLSEMGLATAPTLKNTKKIDLLVSDGTHAKMVQVKTTDGKKTDWPCGLPKKALPDLVYVFVVLNSVTGEPPEFYVVPSADVKKIMNFIDRKYQTIHIKENGKPFTGKGVTKFALFDAGRRSNNTYIDKRHPASAYKDRWDLLGLKTARLARKKGGKA